MKKSIILSIIGVFIIQNITNACTNFIVTRGASANGSTMISYAADSHLLYGELYHWPATDWPKGSMLDVYEWDTGKFLGRIPQVAHTYNVVGNMNEFQVAIGETTYGGRHELGHQKGAIMDYGSLIYISLQRSKTAREAIKNITELATKYGYYSSGESFSVSDKNEAWILEVIGKGENEKGIVWVARRIPDGYVSAHANQARITTFPFQKSNDFNSTKQDCYNSPDVIEFARKKGWFKGKDKDFSFSDTYNPVTFGGARFCEIRVWSMFKDVNKDMQKYFDYAKGDVKHDAKFADGRKNINKYATNRMPLWIKPDRKITLQDMFGFMRDHLEGTELDMTQDVGAGPFGMPYRWRPLTWKVNDIEYCNERATATQQTGFSFVTQSRKQLPDEIGGIIWFGVDDASSCVYAPMYSSIKQVPKSYEKGNGNMMQWGNDAAFWAFNQVSNFAYLRYNLVHPEIDSLQQKLETKYVKRVSEVDKEALTLYKKDKAQAVEYLTEYSVDNGNYLVHEWQNFYKYLFMKYMDGNVKRPVQGQQNPSLKQPGYSKEFYKMIQQDTGDKLKMKGSSH